MPLRTRLSNTGLKLKIPVRNNPSPASPYGPSPSKQSPSPHRPRREEEGLREEMVSTWDASVDGRPVWAVTSQRARTRGQVQGFREIQIQDLSVCDSVQSARNNNRQKSLSAEQNDIKCISSSNQPPVSRSPSHPTRDRQLQRAEILRDWIQKLPTEPNNGQPNPFFSPTARTNHKKELNYRPYKYLSSPLPNFNQLSDSSDR